MIEVYKTNVQNKTQAKRIVRSLKECLADVNINFDLQDRDKILRVEGIRKSHEPIIIVGLNKLGFTCEALN